ncbi:hypothetical protein [Rodentibacter sp. Ppn85]|uniref:hypothetical protein n=1 Tax=Rodentibacter sp. Ppn85 TaxID=1908525 RepID=UPI000987B80E|nr:hypothetical protein [Rodentibacter sp. Ppn85]OOF67224.1 hypothetical protein BKL51_00045 [Rodentibacter sp. Ppn85]
MTFSEKIGYKVGSMVDKFKCWEVSIFVKVISVFAVYHFLHLDEILPMPIDILSNRSTNTSETLTTPCSDEQDNYCS